MKKIIFACIFVIAFGTVRAQLPFLINNNLRVTGWVQLEGVKKTTFFDTLLIMRFNRLYKVPTSSIPGFGILGGGKDSLYVMRGSYPGLANKWLKNHDTLFLDTTGSACAGTPILWSQEVANNADNNWSAGVTLSGTDLVFYNGQALRPTQWSGEGTTTLTLGLDTRQNDMVIVKSITACGEGPFWSNEILSDFQNNLAVSFTLSNSNLIIYNGYALKPTQWTGAGTTTLTLNLDTRQHDMIEVKN